MLSLPYPDAGTATDDALTVAHDLLMDNARGIIPKIMVVITDGQSDQSDATRAAADAAKSDGVTIFAIGRLLC